MVDRREIPESLCAALAFGRPLRDGLEGVRKNPDYGILVVLGHGPQDERYFDGGEGGGDNSSVTEERVFREARNDGALILSPDFERIIRTRVLLNPWVAARNGTGDTRHASAANWALQTGRPTIAVSRRRESITLYLGSDEFRLRTPGESQDEITNALNWLRTAAAHHALKAGPRESRLADARVRLEELRNLITEWSGSVQRTWADECDMLASELGIVWRPPKTTWDDFAPVYPAASLRESQRDLPASSGTAVNEATTGDVTGGVLAQFRTVYGDVHLHTSKGSAPPRPRQPPPGPGHFVGREEDLTALEEIIPRDGCGARPGLVLGGPGMGKTVLALRYAERYRDRFPDGVLFVDLRGADEHGRSAAPAAVLGNLLRSLGVPPEEVPADEDSLVGDYRSLMAHKRVLLILDNAADFGQVENLLPNSPASAVLVTSRNLMIALKARIGCLIRRLDVLTSEESVRLLDGIIDGNADRHLLEEIARLCAGHPLALAIAGAHAEEHFASDSLREFVARLRAERLETLSQGDPSESVRAAFALSYRMLPEEAQRVFRILGLHPGPTISGEMAGVLLPESGRILQDLHRAHLVRQTAERRYQFHDLLREYARERAMATETDGERRAVLRRLFEGYLVRAQARDAVIDPWRTRMSPPDADPDGPGGTAAARAWFDAELENLAAVVESAVEEGEPELAWRLALAPAAYFYSSKPWAAWIGIQETGVRTSRQAGELPGQAWLLDGLGVAYRERGDRSKAKECFGTAISLFQQVGDAIGEAEARVHLAQAHRELQELPAALREAQAALDLFRHAGAEHGEGRTLNLISGIHTGRGRTEEALPCAHRAVDVLARTGDERSHAWALNNLGQVLVEQGEHEEALAVLHQARELRERIDFYGMAFTHRDIGNALAKQGRTQEARSHYLEAVKVFSAVGADEQLRVTETLLGGLPEPEPEPDGR